MQRIRIVVVLLAALLMMSGCGVGRGSAVKLEEGDPVKIGVIPVADFATVYVALDQGYFQDEGLNVQTQTMQNAAAIAPSVINGQLQFGTSAITPVITAAHKGLPVKVVSNQADVARTPEQDVSGLFVAPDSGITRPRDLEGKTVAVNGLGAVVHVAAAAAIKADGGDPSTVTFVAMAFADMPGAVQRGDVAAASVVEPFVGMSRANGLELIGHPFQTLVRGGSMAVLFTAGPFAEENPEVVAKMQRAMRRASLAAQKDPELVRRVLIERGGMKPQVVQKMKQPPYGEDVDPAVLTRDSELMSELGFIDAPVDGASMMIAPPGN
ncbi:ABC transporter substrate-binding protein [Kocuria marina]|uniref:ABC transporter substrate-binding protein n=1 Tax=Kocuria marina TaxID=223184 RepID=UPI003F29158A